MEKELSNWDKEYLQLCKRILNEGVEVENRTGINSIKVPSQHFQFNLQEEFPVLTTKKLYSRQAILEMLWIYQVKSNDVRWLQERNVHVWDEWEIDEDGLWKAEQLVYDEVYDALEKTVITKKFDKKYAHTIGTAYGYILNKFNRIDKIRDNIKNNPNDRGGVISLWQDEYIDTGVLRPCVWSSEWDVTDGKLNAWVHQRSCDVPLGLPFNVTQYAVLLHMLAKEANLKPGTLDWSIKDAHIYVNQIDGIKEQIKREEIYNRYKDLTPSELIFLNSKISSLSEEQRLYTDISNQTLLDIISMALNPGKPELWLNPDVKSFYDYDNSKDCKDAKIKKYKSMGKIDFPIAK